MSCYERQQARMTFLYLILALRDKSRNKSTAKIALLSFIMIRCSLKIQDTIGTFVPVPYNSPLQEGIASHIFTPVRCLIASIDLQGKRSMNFD